jgi:hypothetical protein
MELCSGGAGMELRGEIVTHSVFGSGQIIDFTNNYVTVLFDESKTEKKFIYPSAFGSFLELENKTFTSQIEADKNIIAQKMAENSRLSAELARLAVPVKPKESPAKRKRSPVVKKTSD